MFNPSELEGEVDHSFFDSDGEDGSTSRDGEKKMVKNFKTGENPPEKLQTKQTENEVDGAKKYMKPVENNTNRGAEIKAIDHQPKEKDRDRSFRTSSTDLKRDKNFSHSNSGEQHKFFNGKFMNLLSREEVRNGDQSSNETEDETSHAKYSSSKLKNVRSSKKPARNRRRRTPSPSSSEASRHSNSDGSYSSSSSGRSSMDSPTLPRPDNPLSTEGTGTGVGLAASQDLGPLRADSESTITDVSPLSSLDSSQLHSLNLNRPEAEDGMVKEQERERMPSSGLSNVPQDDYSNQDVDEYSLGSESQLGHRVVHQCPRRRNRKNYSFSNNEVRRIDQENQRLLSQLSLHSQGSSRSGSAAGQNRHRTCISPCVRLPHSAINRQREQRRIETANLAFLKRLETVKPTPGMTRSEQLADYQRQAAYLGGPASPIFTTKKERPTSRTSSAGRGLRPSSAAHSSTTSVSSANKEPGDVPVRRSKKTKASRPDWC